MYSLGHGPVTDSLPKQVYPNDTLASIQKVHSLVLNKVF